MFYLDILIGFSLVMLLFASAVSVAQTAVKRLLAVKGKALTQPLLEEMEAAWKKNGRELTVATEGMKRLKSWFEASMKTRTEGLGKALRNTAVADRRAVFVLLRTEGARAVAENRLREEDKQLWDEALKHVDERWDSLVARLTNSYEHHTRVWILGLSAAAVLLFNVDAIRVIQVLSVSQDVRSKLIKLAEKTDEKDKKNLEGAPANPDAILDGKTTARAEEKPDKKAEEGIAEAQAIFTNLSDWQKNNLCELRGVGLPLWWSKAPLRICDSYGRAAGQECPGGTQWAQTIWLWLVRLFGLAIAAGLIAQGAPFWYSVVDTALGLKGKLTRAEEQSSGADVGVALSGAKKDVDKLVGIAEKRTDLLAQAVGAAPVGDPTALLAAQGEPGEKT